MPKNNVLTEAARLHALGLGIHWLRPRSKVPVESGWTTGPRKSWEELKATYREGYNVGVRLGTPSKIGKGYLAVVDVDVKSKDPAHRKEAVRAAIDLLGDTPIPPVVMSGRGNGSRHYYVTTPKPFKTYTPARSETVVTVLMPSKKPSRVEREAFSEEDIRKGYRFAPAWEVSLYSDGRQVVLPPSLHPDTGAEYHWTRPLLRIGDLSQAPLNDAAPLASDDVGDFKGFKTTIGEAVTLSGFEVHPVELSWLPISEEVRRAIVEGTGVTDRSGYLLKASSALLSAGLSQNEVLSVLTDPDTFLGECGYDHAKTRNRKRAAEWVWRYTVGRVVKERKGETPAGESVFARAPLPPKKLSKEEQEKVAEEIGALRHWRQDLDRTKEGHIRVTLKNLDLILSNSVASDVFIEDLFAARIQYGAKTPWRCEPGEYIEDKHMVRIKRWLAGEFGVEPNTAAILEATTLIADRCQVHPVRKWLKSLRWDGKPRIDSWIKTYCRGQAPEPYLSDVSRLFLLAMVKRIFEPGCQWDYTLVLEGNQGKRKSSMARAIAGDPWFIDNLPDLKDKDSMLNLQGKWLVELGELADIKRHDFNQVKAYLTRRKDTVRPHYGRLQKDVPRQSVFIGTINEGQYLKDPTGNRRYWPVKVRRCDDEGFKRDRDQLFAEAMHVYRTENPTLMLTGISEKQATAAQEERRVDDDSSEMREALLAFRASPEAKNFRWDRFKTRDLMVGPAAPWGPWATKNYVTQTASQVLMSLGFERHKIEGQRYWKNRGIPT